MSNKLRIVAAGLAGFVLGIVVMYVMRDGRGGSPYYSYLDEHGNRPVHTVLEEQEIRDYLRYAEPPSSHNNGYAFKHRVWVFPKYIRCGLDPEILVMATEIVIKPLHAEISMEEAKQTWNEATLQERQEAYAFVCKVLARGLAQHVKVDPDRIVVSFTAGSVLPFAQWGEMFPPEAGRYAQGQIDMKIVKK